jgi:hypothetical protein
MTTQHPVCPHCNQPLSAFELPDNTGWQGEFQLACFNDDCPYYVRGWDHMQDNYAVRASYRYRIDPNTGASSPLPVWSPTALKDRIIEAEVGQPLDASSVPDPEDGGRP